MALGPLIRSLFGRHERKIAALYRACFFDLDDYARQMHCHAPHHPARILEVGCGEGAVTERLALLYPEATILAIDISPRAGRLYDGCRDRVRFETVTVQETASAQPAQFDLVIMSDVVHHIPQQLRDEVLRAVRQALAPGGVLVVKEWERLHSPIHWLCHFGDRWLTGDRVAYLREAEIRVLLGRAGFAAVQGKARVQPWRNNLVLLATP